LPGTDRRAGRCTGAAGLLVPCAAAKSEQQQRSDVIHVRELPRIGFCAQLGEGSIVEQVSDGVSRLDHDQTNRAGTQIIAIGARPESGD
jgi:hypothetical protein